MTVRLIVHGGAWSIPPEYHEAHLRGVRAAVEAGTMQLTSVTPFSIEGVAWAVVPKLQAGMSAVEAVELARPCPLQQKQKQLRMS